MPGVSSGLNHSFDIQACGLIRSPRSASSSWRSFRHRSSQVPTMVTLRSLKRSFKSSLSGTEVQENLRDMALRNPRKHGPFDDERLPLATIDHRRTYPINAGGMTAVRSSPVTLTHPRLR